MAPFAERESWECWSDDSSRRPESIQTASPTRLIYPSGNAPDLSTNARVKRDFEQVVYEWRGGCQVSGKCRMRNAECRIKKRPASAIHYESRTQCASTLGVQSRCHRFLANSDRQSAPKAQRIALNDDDRATKTGSRTNRVVKISPPHFALMKLYHCSCRSIRCDAVRTKSFSWVSTAAHTLFIALVISSGACSRRYCRKASLYSSLRLRPCARATFSACLNTRSGMDTAAFMRCSITVGEVHGQQIQPVKPRSASRRRNHWLRLYRVAFVPVPVSWSNPPPHRSLYRPGTWVALWGFVRIPARVRNNEHNDGFADR